MLLGLLLQAAPAAAHLVLAHAAQYGYVHLPALALTLGGTVLICTPLPPS
jgi:hypothetical protein